MLFLLLLCTLTITACVGGKVSAPKMITMQENSSSAMQGWHLPKNKEWDELFQYVDGSLSKYANTESYWPYSSYTVAGKYLKAKSGWAYNGNGTDKFGFAALPGGFGFSDGYFSNINELGYWWSASESSEVGSYYRFIDYYYDVARYNPGSKLFLLSVRCIRD